MKGSSVVFFFNKLDASHLDKFWIRTNLEIDVRQVQRLTPSHSRSQASGATGFRRETISDCQGCLRIKRPTRIGGDHFANSSKDGVKLSSRWWWSVKNSVQFGQIGLSWVVSSSKLLIHAFSFFFFCVWPRYRVKKEFQCNDEKRVYSFYCDTHLHRSKTK